MRSGIRVRYAAEVEVINNHIVGCNIYPEEPINYSITGVHISLSTRIIASNNYIENYPLNNNSAINGIVVSLPYGNISDIILNNNTYYSGLVFADTVRATKYSDDFYKELIDMPEEKDEQTLIIIPNANYKTTLVPESKYTIWIPGENSDGSGNFNKIYYNGHTYNIINDLNETTEINPINDFTNFIFTKNSFQIINEQGGNSLWKKLYSNTDIKMSTIN